MYNIFTKSSNTAPLEYYGGLGGATPRTIVEGKAQFLASYLGKTVVVRAVTTDLVADRTTVFQPINAPPEQSEDTTPIGKILGGIGTEKPR